jgi:hypothetical protein
MPLFNVRIVIPSECGNRPGPEALRNLPYDTAAKAARALNRDLPKLLKCVGNWPNGARFEVRPVTS